MKRIALSVVLMLLAYLWTAHVAKAQEYPFTWPAACPITSTYGWNYDTYPARWHEGIDLGCDWDTPIVSAKAGTVIYSGWDWTDDGTDLERYGHLDRIDVWYGEDITKGQGIGLVGSTGNSTGPHLHFEVWWGDVPVDPLIPLP